jgi:hypothetical protein
MQFVEGIMPAQNDEILLQGQLDRCFTSCYTVSNNLHQKSLRLRGIMDNATQNSSNSAIRGGSIGAMVGTMIAPGLGTIIGGAIGGMFGNSDQEEKHNQLVQASWNEIWSEYDHLLGLFDKGVEKAQLQLQKSINNYFVAKYLRIYTNMGKVQANPDHIPNLLGELNTRIYNHLEE